MTNVDTELVKLVISQGLGPSLVALLFWRQGRKTKNRSGSADVTAAEQQAETLILVRQLMGKMETMLTRQEVLDRNVDDVREVALSTESKARERHADVMERFNRMGCETRRPA